MAEISGRTLAWRRWVQQQYYSPKGAQSVLSEEAFSAGWDAAVAAFENLRERADDEGDQVSRV